MATRDAAKSQLSATHAQHQTEAAWSDRQEGYIEGYGNRSGGGAGLGLAPAAAWRGGLSPSGSGEEESSSQREHTADFIVPSAAPETEESSAHTAYRSYP